MQVASARQRTSCHSLAGGEDEWGPRFIFCGRVTPSLHELACLRRFETMRQFGISSNLLLFPLFSICLAPFGTIRVGYLKLFRRREHGRGRGRETVWEIFDLFKFCGPSFSICLARFHGSGRVRPKPFLTHTQRRACVLARQKDYMQPAGYCDGLDSVYSSLPSYVWRPLRNYSPSEKGIRVWVLPALWKTLDARFRRPLHDPPDGTK